MTDTTKSQENPILKLALELGPLVLFFFANSRYGIFTATAIFMVAITISLAVSYLMMKRIPVMPLVSGVVVLIFGALTLWLQDDLFIKLKPTIVNTLFGVVLLGGLAFGRSLMRILFDQVFQLTEEGWKKLTFRWGLFFLFLAVLNEAIWRTQTTDFWVAFKVWGVMPITIAFTMAQLPLMTKHAVEDEPAE
ncbi:MAG: septation protein A [Pseudomonadota bacterium]